MRFGVAKDIITPDAKTHMGGYGSLYQEQFVGIHDDLYVKTLVVDDGRTLVVLISLDLLFHDYELTRCIGHYVQERHGIPSDNLILSYTHNHAGPAVRGYDPGQHSDHYEAFLAERIKSCVDRALVNTFEGTIEHGAIEGDWTMCRRKLVDGRWINAPNPEGDKDTSLSILRVRDLDGNEKALLVSYSCHPVTLGDTLWISGEYPGRTCQLLEAEFYGCTAMFFQAAGGCSRPKIAVGADGWKACDFGEVDEMSTAMARAVERAIRVGKLQPFCLDLGARQFVVTLETEARPKEYFARIVDDPNVSDSPRKNEARLVLETYDDAPDQIDLHAAIVRLGSDVHIAYLCGEVTWPVKQHVLKAFCERTVFFIGYGDATAYVPDDRYIDEGGYEVDGSVVEFCLKGRLKKGVDRQMTNAFGRALAELDASADRSEAERGA